MNTSVLLISVNTEQHKRFLSKESYTASNDYRTFCPEAEKILSNDFVLILFFFSKENRKEKKINFEKTIFQGKPMMTLFLFFFFVDVCSSTTKESRNEICCIIQEVFANFLRLNVEKNSRWTLLNKCLVVAVKLTLSYLDQDHPISYVLWEDHDGFDLLSGYQGVSWFLVINWVNANAIHAKYFRFVLPTVTSMKTKANLKWFYS